MAPGLCGDWEDAGGGWGRMSVRGLTKGSLKRFFRTKAATDPERPNIIFSDFFFSS